MSSLQKTFITILICCSSLILSLPLIRSGLSYDFGVGFWGPMGHDGVWHLALTNHIQNPFKIPMPIFSGQLLQNYHPFFNILIAGLHHLTSIPTHIWLFQIFPLTSSLIFLYLSFTLGRLITNRPLGGIVLIFLNTFSNSFGWLVSLLGGRGLSGESLFWSMQPPSLQINPPFALSMVFIYLLLVILLRRSTLNRTDYLLIFLLLLLTPITKSYGGVAIFLLFGLYSLSQIKSRQLKPLCFLAIATLSSFLLFSLYNRQAGKLLLFQPFGLVNSMIDSPDRFYLPTVSSFRQNTAITDPRVILILIFSTAVFLVGNFSWRIIGLFNLKANFSHPLRQILFISSLILSLIPVFFVQQATTWNIIQFFYYAIFFANILLASFLTSPKFTSAKTILLIIIILTSILSNLPFYQNYLGNPPPTSIPPREVEALKFLSQQSPGYVLTYPYDPEAKKAYPRTPIPLYSYETTSYVSAYSLHQTYLEDMMNLNNSGYDWSTRLSQVKDFFSQSNIYRDRGFLINNQIDYIYLTQSQFQLYPLNIADLSLKTIFQNDSAIIYQVKK